MQLLNEPLAGEWVCGYLADPCGEPYHSRLSGREFRV